MYHLATEERVFPVSSVLDCFPFTRIRCQEKIVHDYHLPLIYIYIQYIWLSTYFMCSGSIYVPTFFVRSSTEIKHSYFKTCLGLFIWWFCGFARAISKIPRAISKIPRTISKIPRTIPS